MSVHHARTLHGSAPNVSDRARLMLFYECCAADAWPLMGGSAYIQRLSQQEQWNDFLDRMIIGDPVLRPRMKEAPVRLPYPPAADVSSIFKTQKSGGAKSAFIWRSHQTMKRVYDFSRKPAKLNYTISDLQALKQKPKNWPCPIQPMPIPGNFCTNAGPLCGPFMFFYDFLLTIIKWYFRKQWLCPPGTKLSKLYWNFSAS